MGLMHSMCIYTSGYFLFMMMSMDAYIMMMIIIIMPRMTLRGLPTFECCYGQLA